MKPAADTLESFLLWRMTWGGDLTYRDTLRLFSQREQVCDLLRMIPVLFVMWAVPGA